MRVSDADILIVPGRGNAGPEHWLSRWQAKLSTARRVEQADWLRPEPGPWVEALLAEARASSRPNVIVSHSIGSVTTVLAGARAANVAGAFIVAPTDVENPEIEPAILRSFAPLPREPLPFPSVVVASRNDSRCAIQRASDFAEAWGSAFVDAGEAGHINVEAGYGPWPEGLMRLAGFLAKL